MERCSSSKQVFVVYIIEERILFDRFFFWGLTECVQRWNCETRRSCFSGIPRQERHAWPFDIYMVTLLNSLRFVVVVVFFTFWIGFRALWMCGHLCVCVCVCIVDCWSFYSYEGYHYRRKEVQTGPLGHCWIGAFPFNDANVLPRFWCCASLLWFVLLLVWCISSPSWSLSSFSGRSSSS